MESQSESSRAVLLPFLSSSCYQMRPGLAHPQLGSISARPVGFRSVVNGQFFCVTSW
jgi:hypothetical protein